MPWSDESITDLAVRSSYSALVLDGALPYRDFFFEYPPLAAPAIAVPGIAGTEQDAYRLGIAAATFLVTAVTLLLAGTIARRTGGSAPVAMATVALSPLLLGAVVRLHFDPLAVAFTLAALAALLSSRPALGLGLVGLGAMTKGFPIVVAPTALVWLWFGSGHREAVRGAVALAATLLVIGAGWLALSPEGAVDSVSYQLDRPVQLESSPASALFVLAKLGAEDPSVVNSHGSSGLDHPFEGPTGIAFAVALLMALAALAALAGRAAQRGSAQGDEVTSGRALALAFLAAVSAYVAFGRVLSPQYMIWVVPLLALAVAWRMRAVAGLTAAACVLTLVEFPSLYLELERFEAPAIAITAARNAALIGAVIAAGVVLWRGATKARVEPAARPLTAAG
jgi:uncharacterized membrane protein